MATDRIVKSEEILFRLEKTTKNYSVFKAENNEHIAGFSKIYIKQESPFASQKEISIVLSD